MATPAATAVRAAVPVHAASSCSYSYPFNAPLRRATRHRPLATTPPALIPSARGKRVDSFRRGVVPARGSASTFCAAAAAPAEAFALLDPYSYGYSIPYGDVAWLFDLPGEARDSINTTFGAAGPPLTLLVVVLINIKISEVRREKEGEAAAKVAKAVTDATERKISSIPQGQWGKLLFCLLIDVLGDSSFALPGIGELSDIAYAPLEAFLLNQLFHSSAISFLGFVEEGLPFTDVVPTATLGWVLETFFADTPPGRWLGLEPLGGAPVGPPQAEKDGNPKQ